MNNQNKRSLEEEEEPTVNKVARNDEEEEPEEEEQEEEEQDLEVSEKVPTTKYKIPGYIITGTYRLDTDRVPEDPLEIEEQEIKIGNKNITLYGSPQDSKARYLLIGKTQPRKNRSTKKFETKFTYFYPDKKKLKKMEKELATASSSSSVEQQDADYDPIDEAVMNFLVRSMRNTSVDDFDEQFENAVNLGGKRRKSRKSRKARKSRKSRKSRKARKSIRH
jgi:hypothetical protein